jgi:hypothetical protein
VVQAASQRRQASAQILQCSCIWACFSHSRSACGAGGPAGFEHGPDDGGTVAGLPGQDGAGYGADVGAVQVGPDAPGEISDHLFGETGIGARGTGLGTFEAGGNARGQLLLVLTCRFPPDGH